MTNNLPNITPDLIDRISLRAAAEDDRRKASAIETICKACDELGIPCADLDAEAKTLRQRIEAARVLLRGAI